MRMTWEAKLRMAVKMAISSYLKGDMAMNRAAVSWLEELLDL